MNEKSNRKRIIAISVAVAVLVVALAIVLITVIIPNSKYNNALRLINEGKYAEAYEILTKLNGYKDSAAKAKEIQLDYISETLRNAKTGDSIVFGVYEQDNNTSNGKEKIEWLVLDKNSDSALLISKNIIECRKYSSAGSSNWRNSDIREWLNDSFINDAFDTEIREAILTTSLSDSGTNDKIFLLNEREAQLLFSSNGKRKGTATTYAAAQDNRGSKKWFLRSPCDYLGDWSVLCVREEGDFLGEHTQNPGGIRPAFWITFRS